MYVFAFIEEDINAEKKIKEIADFLETLPYKERTVFGFVTFFDPRRCIKDAVFTNDLGIPYMGIDAAEKVVMDYLLKGRYYADTGTILKHSIIVEPSSEI